VRLWSIHPSYLDPPGLVAAWREALLAQKVLEGVTRGYARHPQLLRFRESGDPLRSISKYLDELSREAERRGYRFDRTRIRHLDTGYSARIGVNSGQVDYEFELLKRKLASRDPGRREPLSSETRIRLNGAYELRAGGIEAWERPIAELLELRSGPLSSDRRDPLRP
jgi:hypothetical protein